MNKVLFGLMAIGYLAIDDLAVGYVGIAQKPEATIPGAQIKNQSNVVNKKI